MNSVWLSKRITYMNEYRIKWSPIEYESSSTQKKWNALKVKQVFTRPDPQKAISSLQETIDNHLEKIDEIDAQVKAAAEKARRVALTSKTQAMNALKLKRKLTKQSDMSSDEVLSLQNSKIELEKSRTTSERQFRYRSWLHRLWQGNSRRCKVFENWNFTLFRFWSFLLFCRNDVPKLMDQLEDQKEALGDMNQEINHMVADDDFELENEYASLINEAAELREGIREHSKPLHALTTSAKTEAQRPVATKEELKKM